MPNKQANHTGGGLAKVTTMNSSGIKTNHYSKESIKTACLKEVQAQFTQANDTPFLMEPLILDLGVIGTQLEHFDQITTSSYQPPPGAPNNVRQLLLLLVRLELITD